MGLGEFLHRIAAESARLGRLVGDLLDFLAGPEPGWPAPAGGIPGMAH